jgi:riboflavin kinase/FMN adenylyltransferase
MSASAFIAHLKEHINFKQLWQGQDFALGKDRIGTVDYLSKLGEEADFLVHVVPPLRIADRVISASEIRRLLSEGDVVSVQELLNRQYSVEGEIAHGDKRGQQIGIPTANMVPGEGKMLPGNGVYACRAYVGSRVWAAAVNIGIRPTFNGQSLNTVVEAHLIEFTGNLYGQKLRLDFVSRLRGEQKFENIAALLTQIRLDILKTREIINIPQVTTI